MNDQDPMQVDREDRYSDRQRRSTTPQPKPSKFPKQTKYYIVILGLFILILLFSFFIFKPSPTDNTDSTDTALISDVTDTSDTVYQELSPAEISRTATQSQNKPDEDKKRIEIPGEVTDLLTQKITELNQLNNGPLLNFEGQDNKNTQSSKELPLTKQLADNNFTIQITASSSLDNLLAFVKQHQLTNYQIYETKRDNKPWFIVIKGNYATNDDAKQALSQLPSALQKSMPWIKSGSSVKQEKTRE